MDIRHRMSLKSGDAPLEMQCKDGESMIVEERRKDASGRVHVQKYIRGRLLGKVSLRAFLFCVVTCVRVDLPSAITARQ